MSTSFKLLLAAASLSSALIYADTVTQKAEDTPRNSTSNDSSFQINASMEAWVVNFLPMSQGLKSLVESKFDYIQITQKDNLVTLRNTEYGYTAIAMKPEHKLAYDNSFAKNDVMAANFYGNGEKKSQESIDSAYALWQGRWQQPAYEQEHYHGGFVVKLNGHAKPVAHLVDGFISKKAVNAIFDDIDFIDDNPYATQFKSELEMLNAMNAKGYSQAMLDFSGGSIDYFIGDLRKLKSFTLLQDTYMHQISFLGYNWGINNTLGRVIAHSSMSANNQNTLWAYEAMGYYPFKSKTQRKMNGEMVDSINMLKPVNPVQVFQQFGKVNDSIICKLDFFSYFVVKKQFNYKLFDGEEILYSGQIEVNGLKSDIATFTIPADKENKRLWLVVEDELGVTPQYLTPVKVNILKS